MATIAQLLSNAPQVSQTSPSPTQDGDLMTALRDIGGVGLGAVASVGNFLDLPGSSVRDILAGENPLDQWATPLSGENRVSGRDLLSRYGMRANRETGIGGWLSDPGEGLRDLAGFAAEVVTDPFGPATKALSAGTAAGRAMTTAAGRAHPLIKALGSGAKKVFDTLPNAAQDYVLNRAMRATRGVTSIFGKYGQGVTDPLVQDMAVNVRKQVEGMIESVRADTAEIALTAGRSGFNLKADDTLDMADPTNWTRDDSPIVTRAREDAMYQYLEGTYDPAAASLQTGDLVNMGDTFKEVEFVNRTDGGVKVKLLEDPTEYDIAQLQPAFMQQKVAVPDAMKPVLDKVKTNIDALKVQAQEIGLRIGDDFDPYALYFPRSKSAKLRQAESITGVAPQSWRQSNASLVSTLLAPGGREMKYKGFVRGTAGVQELFTDKYFQDVVKTLDEAATPLSADPDSLKIFPDMVGIRHVEGFAQSMGYTAEEVWEKLAIANPTQGGVDPRLTMPLMLPKDQAKAALKNLKDMMVAEVESGVQYGVQPGRGWWKSWTDLRDREGKTVLNFNMDEQPLARLDPQTIDTMYQSGVMNAADYFSARQELTKGVPVFMGTRVVKKGKPPVNLLVTPTRRAKVEMEWDKLDRGLDALTSNNPLTQKEAIYDYLQQGIGRNYQDKIDKWMPELDKDGKAIATGVKGDQFSESLKGWRTLYPDAKNILESGEGLLKDKHTALLRLDDESLQALLFRPEQIEDIAKLRDDFNRMQDVPETMLEQDLSVPKVDRHRALAEELGDHVEKRFHRVFGSSAATAGYDYLKKNGSAVALVHGIRDNITAMRKIRDNYKAQLGTGTTSDNLQVNYDPKATDGMTLGEALSDGPAGLFANKVDSRVFLENVRQQWIAEKIPGFVATKDDGIIARQIDEIMALKAPAETWNQMRTLNEIGAAADLPELKTLLKITSSFGSLWKAGTLNTSASTAIRDGFSSFFNGIVIGDMNPMTALGKHGTRAIEFARGGIVDPGEGIAQIEAYLTSLGRKSTPETRGEVFQNMWNAHHGSGSIHPNVVTADAARMEGADSSTQLLGGIPEKRADSLTGHILQSVKDVSSRVKREPGKALNPFNVAGAWKTDKLGRSVQNSTGNVVFETMTGFRSYIDTTTRSMFVLDRLDKTKDLAEAFQMADFVLMNASPQNFTRFEQQWLKPLIPFYSFMRQSIPMFLQELMVNPGGKLGMTVRATRTSQGDEKGYVPFQYQDTTAINLGKADDGTVKYLTSLGLMHEDAVKYAGNALQGDWRGLMQQVLSSASPASKWLVEASTNTSLFSQGPMGGRRLDDLDPSLGRLATNLGLQEEGPSRRATPVGGPLLESMLAASPASRIISMAKIATTDPKRSSAIEKVARLLSGIRVEAVSQEQITRDIRDRLNAIQVQSGARPLTIVTGTEGLEEALIAQGDTQTAATLSRIGKALAMQKKMDAEKDKNPQPRGESTKALIDRLRQSL
jgi:hypothetical protein